MIRKIKLLIANWKMNPSTEKEAREIVFKVKSKLKDKTKVIICPPFVFVGLVKKILGKEKKIELGVQDVFIGKGKSHTGEVGIEMVKDMGVKYVIIGHSEKRALGDTDEIIKSKLLGVVKNNLKAILCIGEGSRNEHGDHYHEIKKQILIVLSGLPKKYSKKLIVAYEPIWAIGKTEEGAINPEKLHEMTIFIRKTLNDIFGHTESEKIPVVYGGSVGKNNSKELLENGKIDGFLVGRESLKPKDFLEII
jgi:triosephosphate isomerase (TIM)